MRWFGKRLVSDGVFTTTSGWRTFAPYLESKNFSFFNLMRYTKSYVVTLWQFFWLNVYKNFWWDKSFANHRNCSSDLYVCIEICCATFVKFSITCNRPIPVWQSIMHLFLQSIEYTMKTFMTDYRYIHNKTLCNADILIQSIRWSTLCRVTNMNKMFCRSMLLKEKTSALVINQLLRVSTAKMSKYYRQ